MFGRFVILTLALGTAIGFAMPTPRAAAPPVRTVDTAQGTVAVELARAGDGHFYATGEVNGQPVRFLVDTGASTVALTKADAQRVGIDFSPDRFRPVARGAGGLVMGEEVRLGSVAVGRKQAYDVGGVVLDDGLPVSLLGQSFLQRLGRVSIAGETMTLD